MDSPLPSNLEPDGFKCLRIWYPDDPGYRRALLGAVSYLQNWFAWERDDNQSGKIAAAKFREAYTLTVDDILAGIGCDGEAVEPPPPEQIFIGGDGDCGESDCSMGCSIPYGSLRMNKETGILEYLNCGNWYPVEDWEYGVFGDQPETPDDGDTEPPDPPPVDIACRKAYWIANQYTAFIGDAWDTWLPETVGLALFINTMMQNWKRFDISYLSYYKLFLAISATKALNVVVWGSVWTDWDTQQLTCLFEPHCTGLDYSLTREEYDGMKSVKGNVTNAIARTVLNTAWDALNFSSMQKLALESQEQDSADCDCPGEDDYFGVVKFALPYTWGTHTGVTFQKEPTLYNNGKIVEYELKKDTGDYREARDLFIPITGLVNGDDIEIRISPYQGTELPTQNWQPVAAVPVTNPALWNTLFEHHTGPTTPTVTTLEGAGYKLYTFSCAADTKVTGVEVDARFAPDNPAVDNKVYYVRYEITKVNGVEV